MASDPEEILIPKSLQPVTRLCGCGSNHWLIVREILRIAADEKRSFYDQDAQDRLGTGMAGEDFASDDYKEFCLKYVDSLGLLEHGTGICGSWITDEGRAALVWLEEHADALYEGVDSPPYYVDDEGVCHG